MTQVILNSESTERQYALKDKAQKMGWFAHKIVILDGDLGLSGTKTDNREDFKELVTNVSMNKVGAIFILEASRLSRTCSDWHKLLELCALTNTLIIDEDGCYDPKDFNDQMLLGLKGTMSHAELHFIRARLMGGKINKAKKGELKIPLPVGYIYDEKGQIIKDPDREIQNAICLLFSIFQKVGTARGVAYEFAKRKLTFPKRAYGGVWKGKIHWGSLTTSRVLGVLHNPSYAGSYVFGRYTEEKVILSNGKVQGKIKRLPLSKWRVLIHDHHPRYIDWKEYLINRKMLEMNRTNTEETRLSSAQREGCALLQGLLLCSRCGSKISIRYKGNGGLYPMYECNKARREGLASSHCMSVRTDITDATVIKRVLEIFESNQLEITISALKELEKRNTTVEKQWQMRIQRAEYEAQLAEKRYKEVDPSNRLVAATLEQDWNGALSQLEQVKKEHLNFQQKEALTVTDEQKKRILQLGSDLPKLWKEKSTKNKDKKRILQLLVKDITVEKNDKQLKLHVRWQGGLNESINVQLPKNYPDRLRYPSEFVEKIRQMAQSMSNKEIIQKLNDANCLTAKGQKFTISAIKWIRYKHKIPAVYRGKPDELTVIQVAEKLGVTTHVIYYWLERGYISSRQDQEKKHWIQLTPQLEQQFGV